MKKLFSLIIMIVIATCFSMNSFALDEEPPVPIDPEEPYSYTSEIRSNLSISGNTATCISTVIGFPGLVTSISITQYLQKRIGNSWTSIKTWSKTFSTTTASFVNTESGLGSGTYRVFTLAEVDSGSSYEFVTAYSTVRTI